MTPSPKHACADLRRLLSYARCRCRLSDAIDWKNKGLRNAPDIRFAEREIVTLTWALEVANRERALRPRKVKR